MASMPDLLPCPHWCQLRAGHAFESIDVATGDAVRIHEMALRVAGNDAVSVYLAAEERLVLGMPASTFKPAFISVSAEYAELTAEHARSLADALLLLAKDADAMRAAR